MKYGAIDSFDVNAMANVVDIDAISVRGGDASLFRLTLDFYQTTKTSLCTNNGSIMILAMIEIGDDKIGSDTSFFQ